VGSWARGLVGSWARGLGRARRASNATSHRPSNSTCVPEADEACFRAPTSPSVIAPCSRRTGLSIAGCMAIIFHREMRWVGSLARGRVPSVSVWLDEPTGRVRGLKGLHIYSPSNTLASGPAAITVLHCTALHCRPCHRHNRATEPPPARPRRPVLRGTGTVSQLALRTGLPPALSSRVRGQTARRAEVAREGGGFARAAKSILQRVFGVSRDSSVFS